MKVKVYEANKIGGCITSICENNSKVIFDYGSNLDGKKQIDFEELEMNEFENKAVFISHYHLDHIGAIRKIPKDIPIYIEENVLDVYKVICDFGVSKNRIDFESLNIKTFKFNEEKIIGSLKIIPYRVDHSAYNSAMFLVEGENEKALYTGDFRNTGYIGDELIPTIKTIGKVEYLIIEGTNIGNNTHMLKKEEELVQEFTSIFKNYDKVFIMMSASNIDRIVSINKACEMTGHIFVQDIYMANLVKSINNKMRNLNNEHIKILEIKKYNKRDNEFKEKYVKPFENKIFKYGNKSEKLVINFRTYMQEYFEIFKDNNKEKIEKACLIHSMWGGYKQNKDFKVTIKAAEELGIDVLEKDIHASGHASEELIKEIIKLVGLEENSENVYKIHTQACDKYTNHSKKDIIEKVKKDFEKIGTLYMQDYLNYTKMVRTENADENMPYCEVISKYLIESDISEKMSRLKNLRDKTYRIKTHDGIVKKITNRGEEINAKYMFNETFDEIGKVIDYQVPLKGKRSDKVGKIDLVALKNEDLSLIELKCPKSDETLLRAILEIETYYRRLDKEKFQKEYEINKIEKIKKVILIYENTLMEEQYLNKNQYIYVNQLLNLFNIEVMFIKENGMDIEKNKMKYSVYIKK